MKNNSRSAGFGLIEIVLVVVVLALIGLIGYRVWDANVNKSAQTSEQRSNENAEDEVPEINNSKDLDKAEETLNNVNIDGTEEAELNEQTNF